MLKIKIKKTLMDNTDALYGWILILFLKVPSTGLLPGSSFVFHQGLKIVLGAQKIIYKSLQ